MDESDYTKLLDHALEQIPEGAKKTERWEIPKAETEIEGKTTIIKNWNKIASSSKRGAHMFKYICKALGTAGDIQKSSGRAVLKSILKRSSINNQIKNYFDDYIICKTCGKPDTIVLKENRNHVLLCQACGTRRIIKL